MEITLLGTGGGAGWPQPCCTCASCQSAYAEGEIRAHTSALVDGVLLLDCGQDVPRSAVRLGVGLDRVRYLLVTHDHHDHANGALLLSRRWAGRSEPLDVLGPKSAVDALALWLPPHDPGVVFRCIEAGDVVTLGPYTVRALAAEHDSDGALIYDVTEKDTQQRFLYATDTGPGFAAPEDARYDLLMLEESWGDSPSLASGRHHDLVSFPATLAKLRRSGALNESSRVVAIHLGHGNPAPSVLRRRLAQWGAEMLPDGAVISLGEPAPTRALPRRVLVLGGARSGKSAVAEGILAADGDVCYVATSHADGSGPPDPEWAERIAKHRARRPVGWTTTETTDIALLLRHRTAADPPLLIDCVTVWLARVMDDVGVWTATDEVAEKTAEVTLAASIDDLVNAWRTTSARVVAVSNEVGAGVVPDHRSGRRFRDELGTLNARLAACCDEVLLVTAGIAQPLRTDRNHTTPEMT
ncbi:MAG: bifunctional adenosylcobinamide kinase/adenosylcobinamide-phosphate guanylyltransferase [Acidothermaceae bacterium]